VNQLQRQDLHNFWAARYQPDNILFSIAGKFDWEHVVERMQVLFGGWSGHAEPSPEQQPRPAPSIALEHQEGKQEHLGLMVPFPNYTDPDYYAAQVLSEVLGGNMTSRLFVEVREKRGLVYSVGAYEQPSRAMGAVFIYAGTPPEKARETAEVVIAELQRLQAGGLTQDELDRAKIQLKSELVMQSESASARMASNMRSWWYRRQLIPTHDIRTAIDAVTLGQIDRVLRRYPPTQPLSLAMVGPADSDAVTQGIFPIAQ